MSFKEFEKDFNKANKSELERKLFNATTNDLGKRLKAWLRTLENLKKLAALLGYEITFSKIKNKSKNG